MTIYHYKPWELLFTVFLPLSKHFGCCTFHLHHVYFNPGILQVIQHTPDDGRGTQQPKRCDKKKEDECNSPHVNSANNNSFF